MSLAQGNNTPTRPRIEPGSPDSESDALTIRPVRSHVHNVVVCCLYNIMSVLVLFYLLYDMFGKEKALFTMSTVRHLWNLSI